MNLRGTIKSLLRDVGFELSRVRKAGAETLTSRAAQLGLRSAQIVDLESLAGR